MTEIGFFVHLANIEFKEFGFFYFPFPIVYSLLPQELIENYPVKFKKQNVGMLKNVYYTHGFL